MKTIICDLDGTLANIDHRLHHLESKDWDSFFAAVKDDKPVEWCVILLRGLMQQGIRIIFVTGRNESTRPDTVEWIKALGLNLRIEAEDLYMRREKDRRPDYLVKEEIYSEYLQDENILFVLEDRKQVVDMWRRKGLIVLHCDEGDF